MSRPRYYWHGFVRKQIILRNKIEEGTLQKDLLDKAINEALAETREMDNGELRLKAIEEVLLLNRKTYTGVAFDLGYEYHTIQRWINKFVYMVGRKAGY